MLTRDLFAVANLILFTFLTTIDASAVAVAERLRASEHCHIICCLYNTRDAHIQNGDPRLNGDLLVSYRKLTWASSNFVFDH